MIFVNLFGSRLKPSFEDRMLLNGAGASGFFGEDASGTDGGHGKDAC